MAKKYLTLNIGAATVELAEYEEGAKGSLTLVAYGTAHLAAPLDAANAQTILPPALMEIVREKGIRPGKVAVSLSGQMVFPRLAPIPMAGGEEKFEKMVCAEIEQNIPFPIDEMVCDRQVVGDTENGDKSVLIVAAKLDQVEALTDAVAAAGFTPELVDVAPLALTNVIRHNLPGDDSCVVLMDIGAKTTSLVIVEGDKLYMRSIPVAGNTVTREVAAALGCSPEEAEQVKVERGYVSTGGVTEDEDDVADRVSKVCRAAMTRLNAEVSRSINFYRSQQGGGTPVRLYLTGGTALLPQIDRFFAESLGLEVEFFNPFERIAVGPKVDAAALGADGALIAATAGAALHLAGLARFTVNLLPPALVEARAEKARLPFLAMGGAGLVAGLVLVALAIGRDTEVVSAQSEAVGEKTAMLKSFDGKVKAAEAALAATAAEAESLRALLSARVLVAAEVNAVRGSLLPGMWIEKWTCPDGKAAQVVVRYWKDQVKVEAGKTVGERVVERLKGKSAVEPETVKIADMSPIGKGDQAEQFTLDFRFK